MSHRVIRLLIVLTFVACFLRRMGGPALADEIDFTMPLEPWVATGPQEIGLWHSPLYPWLLSLLGKLFGFAPAVSRLVGFVCTAVSGAAIFFAAKVLRPGLEAWKQTALLALGLMSPVALGAALTLDYDTTLLVAATATYFYLLVRLGRKPRVSVAKSIGAFGLALAFCFLGKESTPLVYPIGVLVLFWRPFGPVRALAAATASGVLGVALFLSFCWVWCRHYGLPLAKVFEMDLVGLRIHSGAPDAWSAVSFAGTLWVKAIPVLWIGLPLTVLFASRARLLWRAEPAVRAVTSVVVCVVLAYTFGLRQMTYHFPKYMAPVLPWVAWLVAMTETKNERLSKYWLWAVLAWFLIIPDPLGVLYHRNALWASLWLVLTAAPLLAWRMLPKRNPKPAFSSLVLFVTLGLCVTYCREALISQKAITYWYGERAIAEAQIAVRNWRALYPQGIIYAPAKDIHYATRGFGSQYWSKEVLQEEREKLCAVARAKKIPMLFVTRIREDSSLLRSPRLEAYRKCLTEIRSGVDIALGSSYSLH